MKYASIFGGYAESMQVMIDNSLDRFRPTWYSKYFTFAPPQTQLTYTSAIGKSRIEAAASVVDRDSRTPLRSRAAIQKLSGEIPAIREMLTMSEDNYRDFLALQSLNVDDQAKKDQIKDLVFNDVRIVGDSAHKRLDIFALQAVSTGEIKVDININPDGLVLTNPIPLLMPSANKINANVAWSTPTTATPIVDITTVINAARAKGVTFSKILMDWSTFVSFGKIKEVVDSLTSFNSGQKGASLATIDKVNEYLSANRLPVIEVVNEMIGIEKDGVVGAINPWEVANVAFVPAGNLGVIKHAIAIEELSKVSGVSYSTFNKALISKWSENEPFAEYTKVELNAFPALEQIDRVYLLSTTKAFA